ncbi:hypothetical protein [Roseixanthobacter liquoris]|uniref:hypothetical protein n=1 Tax=Roseixanthobacter liquoris TaxID=3119921 RepID=UPI003729B391
MTDECFARIAIKVPLVPDLYLLSEAAIANLMTSRGIPDFETLPACLERQLAMERRVQASPRSAEQPVLHCDRHGACADWGTCPASCHQATRLHRAESILAGGDLFDQIGGDKYLVTVVDSDFEVGIGALRTIWPSRVAGRTISALRRAGLKGPALFGVDVAVINAGKRTFFAPHIHGVIANADAQELRYALKCGVRGTGNARPVQVKKIKPGDVHRCVAYVLKRRPQALTRYVGANGRVETRHLPPRADHHAEIDSWLGGYQVGDLCFRVGFKKAGRFLISF